MARPWGTSAPMDASACLGPSLREESGSGRCVLDALDTSSEPRVQNLGR